MSTSTIIAQAAAAHSLGRWAIIAIVVVVIAAIMLAVLRAAGIAVPAEVIKIGWLILIAVIAILAIGFLISLL